MEYEAQGAKAFNSPASSGQASISKAARGSYKDDVCPTDDPRFYGAKAAQAGRISEVTSGLPSLTGILYDRRSYHLERVQIALSEMTAALDGAADDGFDIRYHCNGPRDMNQTLKAESPPARFPRSYDAELAVTFNQPF